MLIGRPVFWGLAVAGETGARRVLEMLRDELDATMGMCGRTTGASVDRACLVGVSPRMGVVAPGRPVPLKGRDPPDPGRQGHDDEVCFRWARCTPPCAS